MHSSTSLCHTPVRRLPVPPDRTRRRAGNTRRRAAGATGAVAATLLSTLIGGVGRAAAAPPTGAGMVLNAPIVAVASTPDGRGYWEGASDGGVFAFGGAGFYGSTGSLHLNAPIVGLTPTSDGRGYCCLLYTSPSPRD